MKTDELSVLLNRAIFIRDKLLSLRDKASRALDSNSLTEEEDAGLCSDVETYPELLQHRVNQLIELCTTDPKTFAKPRGGVSSEEQYQAFAQSIVRELRRNINSAELVLCRAQAHLPEIISKVRQVSLPLPLLRIWKDWAAEKGDENPSEIAPKEEKKGNNVGYHYLLSYGGKKMRNPIFQVMFNGVKINIQLNKPYSHRALHQALDSLLGLNEGCKRCSLQECLATNIEPYAARIRDGTGRASKKPDEVPGCTKIASQRNNKSTAQR